MFSTPDHKLSYKKSVKRGEKLEDCAACCDEISSEHYSCSECNFFLHKLCAERPQELTHSLHPRHPLRLHHKSPYGALGDAQCSACMKGVEGFTYHCAICEFDLDFICSFPDGLKLNHLFHPEHVLTFEKSVHRSDKELVCVACHEEISGQSTEHYSCRRCNVFLHKLCSEAPLELTHYSHPLHPLQLITENPFSNEEATCHACCGILNGLLYHCTLCNEFTLHLRCAVPTLKPDYSAFSGGTKLNHVCHRHILTLEKVVKRDDKGLVCAACLEGILGPLADYFSCRKCNFFVHKSCEERPRELIHSLHPEHKLNLLQRDPYRKGTSACYSCEKAMNGFVYDCQECSKFVIDFKCAFSKPERRIQNLEQVHHHPLTFNPRISKFSCDLCSSAGDEGKEEQSYACSTCDFMIHKSCAMTKLTQRYKEHEHPLSLVQGVTEDLQIYGRFYCDVCHKTITPEDSVSHCARCRYFVHVKCMITGETGLINTTKDAVDYLDESLIQLVLSGDEFVRWPQNDISLGLIQPLLRKFGIVTTAEPKIRHLSHMEHDLILFQELSVNNDDFFKQEDEEIMCDGCNHPITAPYYCCQGCSYYLHLPCAHLPTKISHSSHSHELVLNVQLRCYNYLQCIRCGQMCNGFVYGCKTCNFHLDLTCVALPGVIIHEAHEHPLFQIKHENEGLCYCCKSFGTYNDVVFKCRSCDVYLHYYCAMYSKSIRHRWDRQHPLDLRYPPHSDHPEHIMCDMCEELVHPMHWLYSCFKCKVSFHTLCAPKYHKHPNLKYGGKVKIRFHPHILKHLRKATLKISCDKCDGLLDHHDVLECETCYYCICLKCVFKEAKDSKLFQNQGVNIQF